MGLAASQARLLLLTARRQDLEFRGQQISQAKILLAMQTEQISTDYARSLNDRQLKYVYGFDQSTGAPKTQSLTYFNLTAENEFGGAPFIVVDSQGRKVVQSESEVPNTAVNNGNGTYTDADSGITYNVVKGVENKWAFQEALRSGALKILGYEDGDTPGYKQISIAGSDKIIDDLYTENDAQAEAVYRARLCPIQNKDKKLDIELKQVETQHKAVDTEYDSVKKIIDKNIEISFKTFA